MSSRAAKKVLEFIFTLFAASSAVFFLSRLAPSDPVEILLGENATFVDREALRKELKLDLPLTAQYASFLAGLLELDFGESLVTKRKVSTEILEALPTPGAGVFRPPALDPCGIVLGCRIRLFQGRP